MSGLRFDEATGSLVLDDATFTALKAHAEGVAIPRHIRHALRDAGALTRGGTLGGLLAEGMQAVAHPTCRVTVHRDASVAFGWVDPDVFTLLSPEPGARGGRRLTVVGASLFVHALVRLNALSPRTGTRAAAMSGPQPPRPQLFEVPVGALAEALGARDGGPLHDALAEQISESDTMEEFAGGLVAGDRTHWRVEVRWDPTPGASGLRVVEVLDTADALWFVTPHGPQVRLAAATPTDVLRELSRLLPDDDEVAGLSAQALRA